MDVLGSPSLIVHTVCVDVLGSPSLIVHTVCVDVLGSLSLIVHTVCGRKGTLNSNSSSTELRNCVRVEVVDVLGSPVL